LELSGNGLPAVALKRLPYHAIFTLGLSERNRTEGELPLIAHQQNFKFPGDIRRQSVHIRALFRWELIL
jgi:hypothetical protein